MPKTRQDKTADVQTDAPPAAQTTGPQVPAPIPDPLTRKAAFIAAVRERTGAARHKVSDAAILEAAERALAQCAPADREIVILTVAALDAGAMRAARESAWGAHTEATRECLIAEAAKGRKSVDREAGLWVFEALPVQRQQELIGEAMHQALFGAPADPRQPTLPGTDEAAEGPEEDEAAGPA